MLKYINAMAEVICQCGTAFVKKFEWTKECIDCWKATLPQAGSFAICKCGQRFRKRFAGTKESCTECYIQSRGGKLAGQRDTCGCGQSFTKRFNGSNETCIQCFIEKKRKEECEETGQVYVNHTEAIKRLEANVVTPESALRDVHIAYDSMNRSKSVKKQWTATTQRKPIVIASAEQ